MSSGTITGAVASGNFATISIANAGIYIVSYSLNGTVSSAFTVYSVTLGGGGATNYNNGYFTFQNGYFCVTGSDILTCTAGSSITLGGYVVGGAGTYNASQCFFKAVRIA